LSKKKKLEVAPEPIIVPAPLVVQKSPWGYVVAVIGNPDDPEDRDTTVCGPEDTKNIAMAPAGHVPLYYIRGENWSDCMRSFHVIQGFAPYKALDE